MLASLGGMISAAALAVYESTEDATENPEKEGPKVNESKINRNAQAVITVEAGGGDDNRIHKPG